MLKLSKIITIVVTILFCLFLFTGCKEDIQKGVEENDFSISERFVQISDEKCYDFNHRVFVDKYTNVMYWFICGGYRGGLSVMLNADGSPMLYDLEKHQVVQ